MGEDLAVRTESEGRFDLCVDDSILFFFLLLAIIFERSEHCKNKDSLLFFYLLLAIIFCK
ncbi:MAG: hypothetical protein GX185_03580 [Tissierellia bacterium]|nr:hypothetical protein [Tissierellia bacterium]